MRRALLPATLLLAHAAAEARADEVERIDRALAAGVRYLLPLQGADGSWRSTAYGAFKDGYSQTPFVLSALLFAPRSPALDAAYRRGVDFVATLGGPDDLPLGYPVYSLAGAALVLSVDHNLRYERERDRLLARLAGRQLVERLGWSPGDLPYGGWGYWLGPPAKPPPEAPPEMLLSSNLSSTLYALGALALGEVDLDEPAYEKALVFVERCQNYSDDPVLAEPRFDDGSFFFTPSNEVQNKAMAAGKDRLGRVRYRGYGSMTADGLRALIRLGLPRYHPRVKAAAAWLSKHLTFDRASGPYPPIRQVQRDSVYYYYVWTTAHALVVLGRPKVMTVRGEVEWAPALAAAVLARQREDGSWANPHTDMREDDPLVATPFAMAALAICRTQITGEWRTSLPPNASSAP